VIRVGTSGWSYEHWDERFYPDEVPRAQWGHYYRQHFPVVEINATFYRLPRETAVHKWLREAPPGFRYVVKGSRYITHIRRLADCTEPVARFTERIAPMHPVLLGLLWQLPPNLERDLTLLDGFLGLLPHTLGGPRVRHAVEFRNTSWLQPDVYDLLARHDAAHVWVSSAAMPPDRTLTTDFAYARFHGLEGGWAHDYTDDELRPFADAMRTIDVDGVAFFNNDGDARAPANAHRFTELLGDVAVDWPPPHPTT
jgi:uncharacterized protein YecE (DUF72 family)